MCNHKRELFNTRLGIFNPRIGVDSIADNHFKIIRNRMVAHGKLNPPYTDTEEYKEILKSKILYWKDGKWVKREQLE